MLGAVREVSKNGHRIRGTGQTLAPILQEYILRLGYGSNPLSQSTVLSNITFVITEEHRGLCASNFFFPPSPLFPVTAYSLMDIPNIWENLKSQFTLIFKECASLSLKKKAEETNIYLVLTVYPGLCRML